VLVVTNIEMRAGDRIAGWTFKADSQQTIAIGVLKKRVEGPVSAVPSMGTGQSEFTFKHNPADWGAGSQVQNN
jgi:hypothetical protein